MQDIPNGSPNLIQSIKYARMFGICRNVFTPTLRLAGFSCWLNFINVVILCRGEKPPFSSKNKATTTRAVKFLKSQNEHTHTIIYLCELLVNIVYSSLNKINFQPGESFHFFHGAEREQE